MKNSLFCPASKHTIELIKNFNQNKKNIFLVPRIDVSTDYAFSAYLINYYVNKTAEYKKNYRTFFCNSTHEALSGVIKIARHSRKKRDLNKKIIILDIEGTLVKPYTALRNEAHESQMIPDALITFSLDEFQKELESMDSYLAILCSHNSLNGDCLSKTIQLCEQKEVLTALVLPSLDVKEESSILQRLTLLPDIFIFGESLTRYEIPFGVFLVSKQIHKPWSTLAGAFLHSSTYGGNRLALRSMIQNLMDNSPLLRHDSEIRRISDEIVKKERKKNLYYSRFCNPGIDIFCSSIKFNFSPIKCCKTKLWINKKGKEIEILDCVTGAGAVIRGHANDDLMANVLTTHVTGHSYWNDLKQKFKDLTSFTHFFPAVSGATAVDIGLNLALATIGLKKIVVFKGNYSGKTLGSLTGTTDENYRKHFGPLFQDIIYIDPFSKDAAVILQDVMFNQSVGLIWFELLQGSTLHEIPSALVSLINENQSLYKYLIGVDEILTGIYRTGKLFAYQGLIESPDIITVSKGLCDGTFPFGMTFVSDKLYEEAYKKCPSLVEYHQSLYTHQLGAHIALNCLNYFTQEAVINQIQCVGRRLADGFSKLSQISPYVSKVLGKGHIYLIKYKKSIWNFGTAGVLFFELFMFKQYLNKGRIFLFFNRCIPSLIITESEADMIIGNLGKLLAKNTFILHFQFYLFFLRTICLLFLFKLRNALRPLFSRFGDSS